ncbi:hypothetical protein [Paraburkholderia sp. BCC1885]|uniref:hypothetical protein n=1 Tax=Paraburkholderia sp. BCC1885 TaxID=2562669 RepID=UPI0011844423|nr:hypothetical protein [Paraburkholderia sp. BCC1885]
MRLRATDRRIAIHAHPASDPGKKKKDAVITAHAPSERLPTNGSFRLLVDAVNDYAIFMLDPSGARMRRPIAATLSANRFTGLDA